MVLTLAAKLLLLLLLTMPIFDTGEVEASSEAAAAPAGPAIDPPSTLTLLPLPRACHRLTIRCKTRAALSLIDRFHCRYSWYVEARGRRSSPLGGLPPCFRLKSTSKVAILPRSAWQP